MINLKLEANAGVEVKDYNARRSNMRQLAEFIDANSAGNAVLVFGDTCSLYTRSIDKAIIHLLTFRAGLMDAWIQAIGGDPLVTGPNITCPQGVPPNISCEVGDKVLFLSLNPDGHPLTDHHSVRARVEFEYTLKSGVRQADLHGGPHGTWFNDLASMPAFPKLASITLRGCDRLNGLILTLTSGQTFTHGGSGEQPYSLNLSLGEYVQSIKLCWGTKHGHTRNFYALATTNRGNSIYAGKTTIDCANATAPSGYGVVGAYGRNGEEIDQLGFIYAQQ
ncbi:unnamed protein product [Rhizoctonia solani]|uniref:Jacalin-type lectin domain-containing protein n=1 Tax=Rhizoctonia solani TaxID=456999 RepID=A0A8H2WSM0_9AGAM|nr:unnamed protein product [Rhizoctonia solani]